MKPNIKNSLSNLTWPWWFPYPSSWLRTFILVPIAFPLNALIIFGTAGILISASQRDLVIFTIAAIAAIILPTIILSFIYHLGWYKWQRQASPKTRAAWFPQGKSLWQGFAATSVMIFSFATLLTLFSGLVLLGCKLSSLPETGMDVAECVSRSLGRITGAIARQTTYVWDLEGQGVFLQQREQIDVRPWLYLWVAIAAYFYQVEYGIRKSLLPFLKKKRQQRQRTPRQKQQSTQNIDPIDAELARLRGDMGLTAVRQGASRSVPRVKVQRSRRLLPIGFAVAAFAGAIAFYFGWQYLVRPQPTAAPVPTIPPSSTVSTPQPEPFPEAVKAATQASQLAQTAKTPDQWQLVAQQWQTAATLMKSVPSDSAQFNLARQKAIEYEKNLQYAQANAAKER